MFDLGGCMAGRNARGQRVEGDLFVGLHVPYKQLGWRFCKALLC